MSSIIDRAARGVSRSSLLAATALYTWCWLPIVAVFFAAFVVRHFVVSNTDVSWFITASEKMLEGQRLYVDLIEVNPFASVFLYLPPVAFARAVGLSPELVVDAFVFLAIGASLWLSGRVLRWAGLGLAVSALALLFGLYAIERYLTDQVITGWTSTVVIVSFLCGINLLMTGVVGLYIGCIHAEVKRRPLFVVDERVGFAPTQTKAAPQAAPSPATHLAS